MNRIVGWTLGILAGVGLLTWAIVAETQADNRWRAWCRDRGGHVITDSKTSTVTTIDSKGKVGVGTSTSTTEYCLTAAGGIIDIRS